MTNDQNKMLLVFKASADGNAEPTRSVTGFAMPRGVVVSGSEIFVGDTVDGKGVIKVFDINADGGEGLKRTISCDFDEIKIGPVWTLTISGSELFVSDSSKIYVFDKAAGSNVRPERVIEHDSKSFAAAYGLAVDDGIVYVGDSYNRIMTFPISADGPTTPISTITGGTTELSGPYSLLVTDGYIYSSQYSGGQINVYKTTDSGDIAPQWKYASADFPVPWMMVMSSDGYVHLSDHQQRA